MTNGKLRRGGAGPSRISSVVSSPPRGWPTESRLRAACEPLERRLLLANIPGLYNTGTGVNGAALGDLSVDPHYRMSGPTWTDPVTGTSGSYPLDRTWVSEGSTARWIGPWDRRQYFDDPFYAFWGRQGQYRYNLQFDLSGFLRKTTQ